MQQQGYRCDSLSLHRDLNRLFDYNVVIFYRSLSGDYDHIIAALKTRGIIVGFSIDDLLWDKNFTFAYHKDFETRVNKFFKLADFFVFTSDYLAKYAPHGKPTFIRRPAMLERRFQRIRSTVENKKWNKDFTILISKGHVIPEFKNAVIDIFKMCQVTEEVKVYYFSDSGKHYPDRLGKFSFYPIPYAPFDAYTAKIAELRSDLILVPLPNDEFHNCKCYPKYLEAGSLGSCILASSIYPYKQAVQDKKTGLLAGSTKEFSDMISWAVANRNAVQAIGQNAFEDVRANHLLGPVAKKLYEDIATLVKDPSILKQSNITAQEKIELDMGSRHILQAPKSAKRVAWIINGVKNVNHHTNELPFIADTAGLHIVEAHATTPNNRTVVHNWVIFVKAREVVQLLPGWVQALRSHTFGEIYGNKCVAQEFTTDKNGLCRLDLFSSTFKRRNTCTLTLTVKYGIHGEVIRSSTVNCESINDSEWISFYFDPIENSAGGRYCLQVESTDAVPGNSISLYFVNHNFICGKLYFNGRPINGCATFRLFYK